MACMAEAASRGSAPSKSQAFSHPASGKASRRFRPSWSACQRRSMSSSSWSPRACSCARCSGVIELSMACAAAIRWAMISSSSSRFRGFSGKKSPNSSMNPSKSGSSPLARCSSISLSAAIMSFIRARSSGDMPCTAPESWSTYCCMSCWRSFSVSSSKRCSASGDTKSRASRPRTWPARSGGSMSSSRCRSSAARWASSARRWSPESRSWRRRSSMARRSVSTTSRSSSATSSYTPPRSKRSRVSSRRRRICSRMSRIPWMRSPLRSSKPCWSMRRRAALMSPW